MRKFSKKSHEEEAICPSCGNWKPTDFTPEQLKDMDWECADCEAKRVNQPTQTATPPVDRGSQEITKYDKEYEWLVKLVKLVTKEGVPAQEIKALSQAHPFTTVDDVGDLAAQIWSLATEKYKIPREWLLRNMPEKKASLKKAEEETPCSDCDSYLCGLCGVCHNCHPDKQAKKADLWQAQEETEDMLDHAPGYLAYEYGQQKDSGKKKLLTIDKVVQVLNAKEPKVTHVDTSKGLITLEDGTTLSFDEATQKAVEMDKTGVFSGAEFSTNDYGVNPTLDNGPFSSPEDHGAKDQKQPFPNTNWLPADDENKDEQPYSNIAASQKEAASGYVGYWIDPQGEAFLVDGTHAQWVLVNADKLQQKYNITIDDKYPVQSLKNAGWARALINEHTVQFEVKDFSNLSFLDPWITEHWNDNYHLLIIDDGHEAVNLDSPFPSLNQAVEKVQGRRFSKKDLKMTKKADESLLSQDQENEIAASSSPAYVMALNNYAEARKIGHDENRSLEYAVDSVKNIEHIDSGKLMGFVNTYLTGLVK